MSRTDFTNAVSEFRRMNRDFNRVRPLSMTLKMFCFGLSFSFVSIGSVFYFTGETGLSAAIQSATLTLTMGGFLLMGWSGIDNSRITKEMALCRTILELGKQRKTLAHQNLLQARQNGQSAVAKERQKEVERIEYALVDAEGRLSVLDEANRFIGRTTRIGGLTSVFGIFLTPFSDFF